MGAKPTTSYLTLAVGTSLTAVTLFCVALLLFPSHETVTPTTTSTSSIETTTSTTIPLSSLNVSPEGVAGEQYEAVRKYIGSHPNEYRNNLSRLKQLVPFVEDTSFARKTESLRALVRYEYDAAVGRAAQTIENSLSELVNEDRFSDALKLLDGDMQGLGQDIRIRIQAEHVPRMKTAVLDAASKRADSLMARAAENAAAGEHNAATELLDRIETFNIPSLTKAATQQKERMRREQAMRKQESLDSRQMLRTVFDEVRSLASRREYAVATAQTDTALRQPLMSDRADELRALQTVVSTASRVYSAAIAGLKRQIGKRWVINGNKGTIVGVDDTTISVAFGQAETRESISDISSHKLEAYARLSGVKETLTNASLSAFWSLCPEEDSIAKAQALARLASKRAEDIEAVTTVLKHFDAGGQSLNNTPEAEATKVKSKSRSFSLFSDERKDGWIFVGDGKFSLSRGVAKPDGGAGVWYFAQRTFEDFVLRVEYLQTKPGNNSGILFRLQDLDGSLRRAARNGYEVQIGLDGETKRSTGSIYGRAAARRAKTVSGRWNDLELVCIGETVFVRINDKPVTKYSGLQFRKGFVGLQNYANEQVWFRDLRLLELSEDLKKHLDRLNREFED